MAVFTYIGAVIASKLALTGTFATIMGIGLSATGALVAGVISAGLAFATAKVLGVFEAPTGNYQDPGVKIQLAPSTDNKVGVAYGRNFMSGPITDVAISNQNDTMHYCITLSEYVDGGNYTVNQIFRDSANLNFSGANVTTQVNKNSTNVSSIANKIRCRVYAGGTSSTNQIFPTTGAVNATTMMPHWTNTTDYSMEDLVFAMVEVDYDAGNSLTGLGQMTFDITNSVSNPGNVLIDYLNNTRYGAGLSNTIIDVDSITGTANTSLYGYSAEQVTYTPNTGGSATQDRWQINGVLSTFDDAMSNINKICQSCATWFMFDSKQGKFKAVPNRPGTSTFSLNDDNIISSIGVSSTELYSLFNVAEVEYADKNRRDQQNTVRVETPAGELNPNEPVNKISYRLDMTNDNIRAENIANIDLNQSRKSIVVTCDVDYTGMQIDVGDIVDLTNEDFGFSAKEFRVVKTVEKMSDGTFGVELTLIEYDDAIYVTPAVTETDETSNTDIGIVTPPVIVPPNILNNFITNVTEWTTTGSGTDAVFTVFKNPATATYSYVWPSNKGNSFVNGDTVTVSGVYLGGVTPTNDLTFDVANVSAGQIGNCINVSGNAVIYDANNWGSFLGSGLLNDATVGTQVEDKPADNLSMSNTATLTNIIPERPLIFDIGNGLEPGDYSFTSAGSPIGQIGASGTGNVAFGAIVNVLYANGYVQNEVAGIGYDNFATIPSILEANQKITISEGAVEGNVVLQGYNTLDQNAFSERGFTGIRYDWVKLNKGDIF